MAFRRPRVNVKPNVQATRPVTQTVQESETIAEPLPSLPETQPSSHDEPPLAPPIPEEPIADADESIKASPIVPVPDVPLSSPVSLPVPSSPITPTSIPQPIRPQFRRKIAPTIGVKTAIHHRRPSASCSGTESETESSRQKHSTTSSMSFARMVPQPASKSIISYEPQVDPTPDTSLNGISSIPTKAEAMMIDTPEPPTPFAEESQNQMPGASSRLNPKISRENLTQYIAFRAQRSAAKVGPDMTIRTRRAATLGKIDKTNANKGGTVDTSKLTIADFVHYNPTDNPMEVKIKATTTTATTDASTDPVRKLSISSTDGPNSALAPQLKLDANGALILDEQSLFIRNAEDAPRNTVIVEGQFNDDNLTHQSYRKIGRRKRWNNKDTLRFYQALRMCGTDFTLISRVFPNRDRDDIKRKFKTEDKANRTLIDSALSQRIPFDLTCFYSPSEDSSDEDNENNVGNKPRKRRTTKRKPKQAASSDPLEINRRREKRLQAKKNSLRIKKSAEFIDDEDEEEDEVDETSIDVADTVEVVTTGIESKHEHMLPSSEHESNVPENSMEQMTELESLLGRIDGGHLLFVHNTDETTGLDRIDVHVVMSNTTDNDPTCT